MIRLDGSSASAGFGPLAPAPRPHSGAVLLRILTALRRWQELAQSRQRLRELDDRLLRDVGLSRRDVAAAAPPRPWD